MEWIAISEQGEQWYLPQNENGFPENEAQAREWLAFVGEKAADFDFVAIPKTSVPVKIIDAESPLTAGN